MHANLILIKAFKVNDSILVLSYANCREKIAYKQNHGPLLKTKLNTQ